MPSFTSSPVISDTAQIGNGVIVDADINAAAAIAYSKLALALGIVNGDISASAAIVDTKLATISTAGKVSGAALTSLSSIPAGAGLIPSANLPASQPFLWSTDCSVAARFSSSVGGSGANTIGNYGLACGSAATGTSFAKAVYNITGDTGEVYNKSPIFGGHIFVNNPAAASGVGDFIMCLGAPTVSGSSFTYTNAHIGFKITKTGGVVSLYATQADGSTENASAALTTLVVSDDLDLYLKVNSNTSVDYYWRKNGGNWSSATNLTTNMPTITTTEIAATVAAGNHASAFNYNFNVLGMFYAVPVA